MLKDITLTEAEWISLDKCILTLQPAKSYSLKLQKETCTLSDFFGYWMSLKINLSAKTDDFSKELLNQMCKRHDMLVKNPAVIAAVYLDPRYQRVLTEEKPLAVEVLGNIYSRLQAIEKKMTTLILYRLIRMMLMPCSNSFWTLVVMVVIFEHPCRI